MTTNRSYAAFDLVTDRRDLNNIKQLIARVPTNYKIDIEVTMFKELSTGVERVRVHAVDRVDQVPPITAFELSDELARILVKAGLR